MFSEKPKKDVLYLEMEDYAREIQRRFMGERHICRRRSAHSKFVYIIPGASDIVRQMWVHLPVTLEEYSENDDGECLLRFKNASKAKTFYNYFN